MMTQDEKLKLILDTVMEDANASNNTAVEEYKASLESIYEERINELKATQEARDKVNVEALVRTNNSKVSKRQIKLRRMQAVKQEEYRNTLFDAVIQKLMEYKKTPEYVTLLNSYVELALSYAGDEEVTIYIDRNDESHINEINSNNAKIVVCDVDIMGGIRAEIPAKNVLIDESFASKLQEAKHRFNI